MPKDAPVLVAVSGGADSMVLLHLLRKHKIVVAHFNHQLRDAASDADQKLVEQTARELGAPFVSGQWEADKKSIRQHGLEKAARDARLVFLSRTARQHKCHWVAMGHHADDQVETFFWRLLRGAGGSGLGGMKQDAPFPGNPDLRISRPFLELRKSKILLHAETEGISYRKDESNADPTHLRNRIRNQLLPMLRNDFRAQTDSMLLQSMGLVGTDADCVKHLASQWLAAKSPQPFAKLHPAMQRQVIWHQLITHGVKPGHLLIESLRLYPGQARSINPAESIWRDPSGTLHICKTDAKSYRDGAFEWVLNSGWNESVFGGAAIRCRTGNAGRVAPVPGVEFFDAERVGPRVLLRHWQAGDRFQPIGLGRSAKLQDLFTNAKVASPAKRERVIACAENGEIFWVQGLRIGEMAKIRPQTKRVLEWHWMPV